MNERCSSKVAKKSDLFFTDPFECDVDHAFDEPRLLDEGELGFADQEHHGPVKARPKRLRHLLHIVFAKPASLEAEANALPHAVERTLPGGLRLLVFETR